jgi:endonuclease YncB( thermonuclease family)
MAAAPKENRRTARMRLDEPMHVTINSMGDAVPYETSTRNVSQSGFFLEYDRPSRFPFNHASILEVRLKFPDGQQIFFNGKVARVVNADDPGAKDTGSGIGIKIVQIDAKAENVLRSFLDRLFAEQQRRAGQGQGNAPDGTEGAA